MMVETNQQNCANCGDSINLDEIPEAFYNTKTERYLCGAGCFISSMLSTEARPVVRLKRCKHCKELMFEGAFKTHGSEKCVHCSSSRKTGTHTVELFGGRHFVGVELETIGSGYATPSDYDPSLIHWSHGSDGSIHTPNEDLEGIEWKSPVLHMPIFKRHINRMSEFLSRNGYTVNTSCGFHVHMDMRNMEFKPLQRFIALMYHFEPLFFAMMPSSRKNNSFCKSLRNGSADQRANGTTDWMAFLKAKTLNKATKLYYNSRSEERIQMYRSGKHHNKRYDWMNLHSYFYRGTMEIRLHSGTLDKNKIINWVNLLNALKCAALHNVLSFYTVTDAAAGEGDPQAGAIATESIKMGWNYGPRYNSSFAILGKKYDYKELLQQLSEIIEGGVLSELTEMHTPDSDGQEASSVLFDKHKELAKSETKSIMDYVVSRVKKNGGEQKNAELSGLSIDHE